MKAAVTTAALVVVSTAAYSLAQPAVESGERSVGPMPADRAAVIIEQAERNPFGRREKKGQTTTVEEEETEESKIRGLLARLPVTGVRSGPDGVGVLLGSLILRQGRTLPPVIRGQTEVLYVTAVTPTTVEISFVERSERAEPRKIVIPVDMRPRVAVLLPGGSDASREGSAGTMRATPIEGAPDAPNPQDAAQEP